MAVRPGRVRLARALILLEAAVRGRAGPGRPEDKEAESVQRYLGGPGGDGKQDHGRHREPAQPHREILPGPARCLPCRLRRLASGFRGPGGGFRGPGSGLRRSGQRLRRSSRRLRRAGRRRCGRRSHRASGWSRGPGLRHGRNGEVFRDIRGHPAQITRHRQDGRPQFSGVPFRRFANCGRLVRRLLPDRGGLPFGSIANCGGLTPRCVRDIGRLVIGHRHNPSGQPDRVGNPDFPGRMRGPALRAGRRASRGIRPQPRGAGRDARQRGRRMIGMQPERRIPGGPGRSARIRRPVLVSGISADCAQRDGRAQRNGRGRRDGCA
jgi:hypothetical protein